jgi:predicted  nucleic acid-binding Zn-ribbon protein
MSNSDFFSLFPEDDSPLQADSDELTQLFDQTDSENPALSGEADLDNFAVMFDEILLDTVTAAGQDSPDCNPAVMAIALGEAEIGDGEELVMAWEEEDSGLSTDLGTDLAVIEAESEQEEDPDELSQSIAHPLIPPFLQSYQTLQGQVAQLTEQMAIAEQQLVAYQRRADSAEALIHQQAAELTQAQERLSHTVAELQIHQEEAKRQQLQVETLADQLSQRDSKLKEVSEQLAQSQHQLAIVTSEKQTLATQLERYPSQISGLEEQIDELRSRLQRQQRYALQHKLALEQCLAQPDFRPSSDIHQVVARLTGQSPDPQPWASVGDILAAFPQSPADTPPLTPQPLNQAPQPEAPADPSSAAPEQTENRRNVTPKPHHRRAVGPDTLSFAVREQKKAPDRHVELPNFLARAASVSR